MRPKPRSDSRNSTPRKSRRNKKQQYSFTQDSPYFTSYVDKEMKNVNLLSTTLKDISSKAKTFGKCGVLMSEATRRLSLSCKLHDSSGNGNGNGDGDQYDNGKQKIKLAERKKSVGDEMVGVLQVLGDVLDEIADAQLLMVESLEASLSLSLETFIGTELYEADKLKSEAEEMTETAELSFAKYLHGKNAQNTSGMGMGMEIMQSGSNEQPNTVNKFIEGVGNQLGRMGISSGGAVEPTSPSRKLRKKGVHAHDKNMTGEPAVDKAIFAANLKHNLEEIRLVQANSELKRFQLLKHLDALKTRRNFGLGENILASLNGIKAYFHHCSDLTESLAPRLQSIQEQQKEARDKYESQQAPLENREKGLNRAINEINISAANAGVIADAISRGQTTGLGSSMIADQPTSLEDIEKETKIWELPRLMCEHTLYMRDPKPGIEVEGWLYKKASSRMAMNTWSKRWFVLDRSGIYYLKGGSLSENGKFGSSNGSLERVKVCDIVLCTVREVNCHDLRSTTNKANHGIRFCFEILSPNTRPYMLQACGPLDMTMWVNNIRRCLERQLVHGNLPSDDQLIKPGTPKTLRSWKNDVSPVAAMENDGLKGIDIEDDSATNASFSTFNSEKSPQPKNPMVSKILDENRTCADCNEKVPEWVSLNLGALICIECSGVHRSLGVHLSKVRSLRLDQLSKAEYGLINSLGNTVINSVWEGGVKNQKGWSKPLPTDSRKSKEEWIKSKYMWKGFIHHKEEDGGSQDEREATFNSELYEASRQCDVRAAAEALAKGANVNFVNEDDGGKTPLQACIVSKRGDGENWMGIETAELLIQNGANSSACGDLLGHAEKEMMQFLMTRIT